MKTLIDEGFKKFLCEFLTDVFENTVGMAAIDEDLIDEAKHHYMLTNVGEEITQWVNYRNYFICRVGGKFKIKERLRGGEYVDNLEFNTVKEAAEYLVRNR